MQPLALHDWHAALGAQFVAVNGMEVVSGYADLRIELEALQKTAGWLDLSCRSRVCLTGADRIRFLHGQVTNDIQRLRPEQGCYAALVTAKGRIESDVNVYCLEGELLLDFEPGLAAALVGRLEKFIVADDVQVVDVAGLYGLLSVQGPTAGQAIERLAWFQEVPPRAGQFVKYVDAALGEIYLANQPRVGSTGYDLFVPADSLGTVAERLRPVVEAGGGRSCGWQALEVARIEAGIPRFGADMDEKTLPQECGIESRAVSYSKGCYIGQEVLNRIHTQGHVNRQLRLLRLPEGMAPLPVKGDKLFHEGKEVGHVTSVAAAPSGRKTALGYVRREAIEAKAELVLQTAAGQWPAVVCRI